jgi:hypothetical protein
MFKIEKPGIYLDVSAEDYFRDPCKEPSFTQSIAKVLLDASPAHARLAHPRLCPPVAADEEEVEKYSSAAAIGNAAHRLLIGRGKEIAVEDFDSWRGKAADVRKAHEAVGKVAILSKHMARAYAMVEAAYQQLGAVEEHCTAFRAGAGSGEVVLAWQENGLWCRTMIDWHREMRPSIYDYKTSGMSCAPHVVEDRPSLLGWDIQAAMHERGLGVLDPASAGRLKHFYVNQENEPPYALTVVQISEADLTMGRKKLAMAFSVWSACLNAGHWPMYPAETVLSRPRAYLETKFLEREIAHDERKQREPMPADLIMGG